MPAELSTDSVRTILAGLDVRFPDGESVDDPIRLILDEEGAEAVCVAVGGDAAGLIAFVGDVA